MWLGPAWKLHGLAHWLSLEKGRESASLLMYSTRQAQHDLKVCRLSLTGNFEASRAPERYL